MIIISISFFNPLYLLFSSAKKGDDVVECAKPHNYLHCALYNAALLGYDVCVLNSLPFARSLAY